MRVACEWLCARNVAIYMVETKFNGIKCRRKLWKLIDSKFCNNRNYDTLSVMTHNSGFCELEWLVGWMGGCSVSTCRIPKVASCAIRSWLNLHTLHFSSMSALHSVEFPLHGINTGEIVFN